MDLFAAEIGMDPAEVRRRNLHRRPTQFPFTTKGGATYDSGEYAKALDRRARRRGLRGAARRAGRAPRARRRRPARHRRLARSSRSPAAGAFTEDAAVEVHADGTVTVLTGTSPHGQGHATAWAMLASEQLGIPIEKITVKHGDTDLVPRGAGTDGLAQPADRAASRCTRRRASWSSWPSSARPTCWRPSVDDLVVVRRRRCGVARHGRRASRSAELAETRAAARRGARSTRARRRSRSARTSPSSRSTSSRARRSLDTDRHRRRRRDRCSTRCSPRASGTAASRRASPRRCSRRSSTTRTATRSRPRFADYGIPSAAELPSFTLLDMATPTHLNPLGRQGHRRGGHHRRHPGRRRTR